MSYKSFVDYSRNRIKSVVNDIKSNKPFFLQTGPNTNPLLQSGAKASLDRGIYESHIPDVANVTNLTPKASILIKKKAFSTLNVNNDLRWMDKSEKFLLRATKALFAYKVQQIRAYESMSKIDNFFSEYNSHNLNLIYGFLLEFDKATASSLSESSLGFLKANKLMDLEGKKLDIYDLLKRNYFSLENQLTTWIVDPTNIENYSTGPGTGVIEINMFSSFGITTGVQSSPKSASITLEDPYNLSTITEKDINFAIEEAFYGTFNLFKSLVDGSNTMKDSFGQNPTFNSSELSSIALNAAGLGDEDKTFDIEYCRERLRTFYLGKPYINPADSVHYYISTRKNLNRYEDETLTFDDSTNDLDESVIEAERLLYTRGKLNFEEYKKIRRHADSSFNMTHVFGGFVQSTSSSYGGGKNTLSVSVTDNMAWLSWSRYAQTPGLQDYVGVLDDPLTPFKFKTDELGNLIYPEGIELLPENKLLLDAGLLSFNSGLFKGQNAKEGNLFQQHFNDFGSLKGTKALQHPDGFIYRWKNGIQTVVADFQTADPTGNSSRETKIFNRQYAISAANDTLNNLDIANILSILITGQPYNTETFLLRAYEAHNISTISTNLNPYDPLSVVLQSLKKQNYYYGNFKPYRTITLNRRSVQKQISDVSLRNSINGNLKKIQKRKLQIQNQIRKVKTNINNPEINAADNILISTLERELFSLEKTITEQINVASNAGLLEEKNLISFDFNFFNGKSSLNLDEESEEKNENLTRAMMKVGALRRIEDVRLNRDKNLFVISDQYDYNTDLRPFLLGFKNNNFKLFSSQYIDTLQNCVAANNVINFEFFCNSQGHLEFRPPGWNKTPLSVLREYLTLDSKKNTKYIPEYITKVFENRVSSLSNEIQSLNVSIVLAALMLGRFPDKNLIPGIKLIGRSSLSFFGVGSDSEKADDPSDSLKIRLNGVRNQTHYAPTGQFVLKSQISFAENGKILMGDEETILGEFDAIVQEKSSVFNNILTTVASPNLAPARKYSNVDNLNQIRDTFLEKTGIDPASILGLRKRKFKKSDLIFSKETEGEDDALKAYSSLVSDGNVLSKLKQVISSRDRLVTILSRNREKQDELEQAQNIFDEKKEGSADDLFMGAESYLEKTKENLESRKEHINYLNQSAYKGSVYDHLIDDDTKNILGYGSGRRFIIEDHDIISANFSENPPDFTRVTVKGDAPLNLGGKLQNISDGLYFFAGATDFDLWRQYGYKSKDISAPFLSDSEGQCKPYALFQLQKQRININKGSVTVIGNEFYQPGDSVFIRSKCLIYYVETVNHQFSFGSTFNTSLSLSLGRPPGMYLPSPLDVIGQQFSTDPLKDKVLNYRSPVGDDEYRPLQPHSALLISGSSPTKENVLSKGENQSRFGNMIIDLNGSLIGKSQYLLLRIFINSEPIDSGPQIEEAKAKLNVIADMFSNPEMVDIVNDDEVTVLSGSGIDSDIKNIQKSILPTKKLSPMLLPNSIRPNPIPKSKILMQISFLKKQSEESASFGGLTAPSNLQGNEFFVGNTDNNKSAKSDLIVCLDSNLADTILDQNGNIKNNDSTFKIGESKVSAKSIFPSDGPRQSTWLDIRDLYGFAVSSWQKGAVSDLVEIGIIDISSLKVKGK